jgi:adenine-specific DNA methylase
MNHFLQLCNKKWPKVRSINNDESIEIIVVDPYYNDESMKIVVVDPWYNEESMKIVVVDPEYNDESMKIVVVREPTYIETKPLHP